MTPRLAVSGCVCLAAAMLAGCCSDVTTDPRDGGLRGGVCGTTTGAYDRRIVALQTEAGDLDVANRRLQASLNSRRSEAGSLGRDIENKRRQLAGIRREIDGLNAQSAQKQMLVSEVHALMAEAARREQTVIAIEQGVRQARNDHIREAADREAARVPVEDLLRRIRDLRASLNR